MALTRPTLAQLNTTITALNDSLTVINKSATSANQDIGLIFNRDGGGTANVAVIWDETNDQFALVSTSSTGATDANVTISDYAELATGNVTAPYYFGNGSQLTGVVATGPAGPAFKAVMSATTAISNAGTTKLVLNTEEWDTNSNYDTANYRFTPTVAGYYLITGSVFMSTATTARVGVAIYKNGSEHAWQFTAGVSSGGGANPQVSTIVYANGSTDYFELYAAQNYASSVNAANNGVLTWFSGALVRAA